YGMHCLPYLREYSRVKSDADETKLVALINRFKDHPGLGVWKGDDEPEWGKVPLPPLIRAYEVIKKTDPNHPVAIIHAPRGTVESPRKYNVTGDILGAELYRIGYPPGKHSTPPNKRPRRAGTRTRL